MKTARCDGILYVRFATVVIGHVIVFKREPETQWKHFEAQLSDWNFHVHINQALAMIVAIHI